MKRFRKLLYSFFVVEFVFVAIYASVFFLRLIPVLWGESTRPSLSKKVIPVFLWSKLPRIVARITFVNFLRPTFGIEARILFVSNSVLSFPISKVRRSFEVREVVVLIFKCNITLFKKSGFRNSERIFHD